MSASTTGNVSNLLNLITRYAGQVVQALTTVAGLTGLFYAIGFIFVNLRLMRLGLFEPGLVRVGYIVPGLAFGILCLIVLVIAYLCYKLFEFAENRTKLLQILIRPFSVLLASAGAWGLARLLWFWRNQSLPVAIWLNVLALLFMASAPEISERIHSIDQDREPEHEPDSDQPTGEGVNTSLAMRGPGFIVSVYFILAIAAIVTYGYFVFPEVPPAFGGGQPIVVRFFGENVAELSALGIRLEPGETKLTERVELIAQTTDRYIVHVGNRAVAFDQSFVQGVRSEPPEFFLDTEAFLEKHTQLGQRHFEDGAYAKALSEFNRALSRNPKHISALRGRAETLSAQGDYSNARFDYQILIDIEPENGENHYEMAILLLLTSQEAEETIPINTLAEELHAAIDADVSLRERAHNDANLAMLRGKGGMFEPLDETLYGSGPAAARWFRQAGAAYAEAGDTPQAISSYETAIAYAEVYSDHDEALTPGEIVELYVAMRDLYLLQDQRDQAIEALKSAVEVEGLSATDKADVYVALSDLYLAVDPLSEEAMYALQDAVEATSERDPTYLILLADLYRARNEPENALSNYDKALKLTIAGTADSRLASIGQGRSSIESGNYLKAISAFESALANSSYTDQDASLWYDYARALAGNGSIETQAALRIALDLDLDLALKAEKETLFSAAGTAVENLIKGATSFREARELRNQGDLDGAIAAYQNAINADPTVVRYRQELGDTLVQAGKHEEAVIVYGAALHPTEFADYSPFPIPSASGGEIPDPVILIALGSAQLVSGDPQAAATSLTEAIASMTETPSASTYALLAQAYEAQGAYENTALAYTQAAEQEDSNQTIYAYLAGINWLLADEDELGLDHLSNTLNQGGLRVGESTGLGLRDAPSGSGVVVTTLGIGSQLRITGDPVVDEGVVWWPVIDHEGNPGWVRALAVVPSPPPDVTVEAGD